MSKQAKQLLVLMPILAVVLFGLWVERSHFHWYFAVIFGLLFLAKVAWAWRQQKINDAKAAQQANSN